MPAGETNGQVPQLDLRGFDAGESQRAQFLAELRIAAHEVGFFYLVGHGVEPALPRDLRLREAFFCTPRRRQTRDRDDPLSCIFHGLQSSRRGVRTGGNTRLARTKRHWA